MDFEVFATPGLGDNSYLLRSGGEAVLVDPQRDAWRFLAAAEKLGARVRAVLETRVHHDYVSGAHEVRAAAVTWSTWTRSPWPRPATLPNTWPGNPPYRTGMGNLLERSPGRNRGKPARPRRRQVRMVGKGGVGEWRVTCRSLRAASV